jgi:hypothetical protein
MRKGQHWIVHAILWVWLLTLGLAAWPSTAAAAALFAALVLWETARVLKMSRPQPKALRHRASGALASPMEPVRDS